MYSYPILTGNRDLELHHMIALEVGEAKLRLLVCQEQVAHSVQQLAEARAHLAQARDRLNAVDCLTSAPMEQIRPIA